MADVQSGGLSGGHVPLVSVFMFVRNRAPSVRRAVDSVLAQTYPNIEFLVQDAASTDGTLELLRSYGDRIKLISAPDSGPNEGLWLSLNRCTGEFIGSCLSDEELLPDAVKNAVATLQSLPDVGAITGDAIITDFSGKEVGTWKSGPFNLVDYLLCDYTPYWVSSFFRRQALIDAGLKSDTWGTDCVEFETWCRLAVQGRIEYVAGATAKYASHSGQSSNDARDVTVHFKGRLKQIAAICSAQGFFGENPLLRTLFIWGHARAFINHAIVFERPQTAEALYRITLETLAGFPPVELDGVPYDANYGIRKSAKVDREVVARRIPAFVRSLLGTSALRAIETRLSRKRNDEATSGASALKPPAGSGKAGAQQIVFPPPPDRRLKAKMYAQLAARYEEQGRVHEALNIWRAIAHLLDADETKILPQTERSGYTPKPV